MSARVLNVARDGEPLGKFALKDLADLIEAGFLRPDDDYWISGMSDWRPLSELPELRAVGGTTADWRSEAKDAMVNATGLLARGTTALAQKAREFATESWDRSSLATHQLLEDYLPKTRELVRQQLEAKPFLTSKTALENDDLMRRMFGSVFDTLPAAVRRWVDEDHFVGFCMDKRADLLTLDKPLEIKSSDAFTLRCRHTHTRLLVNDFPLVFAYYKDVLGLPVRFQQDGIYAEFDTGPSLLALFHREFMAEALQISAPHDNAHTLQRAVVILSVEDVDAVYVQLRERNVSFASEPANRQEWGVRTVHLVDPEGNLIEINSPLRSR
jgi:lactoylglutathione lyase